MKNRRVWILCAAICLVVLPAGTAARAQAPASSGYCVTEPYVYPVVPGTEEWKELSGLPAMIEACAVDEELMRSMTTPALLETVLNYPLLVNIYAFNTVEEGIKSVSRYFKGLGLLAQREDAAEVLSKYRQTELRSVSTTQPIMETYVRTLAEWLETANL